MDDLTHFFSGYFYEAWDEHEYGSWEEAVDDFARRSPERIAGAAEGLQALLDEPLTDAELDGRLRTLGCTFVSPEGDRAWLAQLRERLRSAFAGTQFVRTPTDTHLPEPTPDDSATVAFPDPIDVTSDRGHLGRGPGPPGS